jgi:hypothetical protein
LQTKRIEVNKHIGTGRRSAQEAIIDRKVRNGDIFLNIGNTLMQDIGTIVAKSEVIIKSYIDSMYDNIRRNVTLAISEDIQNTVATPTPRHDAALERRLRDFLATVSVLKARNSVLFVRDGGALDALL